MEVEIFWPAELPRTPLLEAELPLREAGIDTTSRLRPVRRGGVELSVLVLLTGSVLEPFLKGLFERLGGSAHAALESFVRRLLRPQDGRAAPTSVMFESVTTHAQFIFTPHLPEEAFRQAVALDPGGTPGRWLWEQQQRRWSRFEEQ
jgi:hypothetical protein